MSKRVKKQLSERRFQTIGTMQNLPDHTPPFSYSTTEYNYAAIDCVSVHRRHAGDRATSHLGGVRYYGRRYYNPGLGRWVSRDPIGERGGLNLYLYCMNESINNYDYLGLKSDKEALGNAIVDLIFDAVDLAEKTKDMTEPVTDAIENMNTVIDLYQAYLDDETAKDRLEEKVVDKAISYALKSAGITSSLATAYAAVLKEAQSLGGDIGVAIGKIMLKADCKKNCTNCAATMPGYNYGWNENGEYPYEGAGGEECKLTSCSFHSKCQIKIGVDKQFGFKVIATGEKWVECK